VQIQGLAEDKILESFGNNLPNLPTEKFDILLGAIPIELLTRVHFE